MLGYDNTKKMVLGTGEEYSTVELAYSTSCNAVKHMQEKLPSLYNIQWAIFVPEEGGAPLAQPDSEPHGTWYLTTKAISLIRAETMVGRGTMAWRVLELLKNQTTVKVRSLTNSSL